MGKGKNQSSKGNEIIYFISIVCFIFCAVKSRYAYIYFHPLQVVRAPNHSFTGKYEKHAWHAIVWRLSALTSISFGFPLRVVRLDVGDGREMNLEKCPRSKLQSQCIEYLGPVRNLASSKFLMFLLMMTKNKSSDEGFCPCEQKEREAYEVIVKNGKLLYKQTEMPVCTKEGSKWIFVLSTSRELYVGEQKKKGTFQHSSFLAGGAITAAGRLVAAEGALEVCIAIWPYSGHYLPTEENFREFIIFLQDNNVDLSNVKKCSVDDDEHPSSFGKRANDVEAKAEEVGKAKAVETVGDSAEHDKAVASQFGQRLPCKWTTAAGARIGCVRDYPVDLQTKALEQVNLSPRVTPAPGGHRVPIPSPRPSPKVRLSPRLHYMGIPSPTVSLTLPEHRRRLHDDAGTADR
ncbi:hypothetical protein GW17_00003562 [Ensete ventricosum]|nr:hypothetical protein GW17_00003562 [Ensete ventricosum]